MRWNSSPGRRVTVDVKAIEARTSGAWFLVMLGSLTMLPPLSIDISLPGLPLIARTLGSPPALLQWTLSAFILAFGAGQLILGPLSDRYGRRPVLLWGLGLYALAGISCTLVNDARLLVALRLLQGFGACAGTVCARAVAQDLSTDRAGATFRQAILTSVNSFAPVIAPLLGAVILATLGWRALYGVLAVVGVVLVALVAVLLPETSPRIAHPVWGAYRRVLQLPRTLGLMLLVGGSFFGFFSLISGSPFALIAQLHLTSTQFAIAFAINSLSFIVAAALSARLVRTLDPEILFGSGVAFTLVATILAFVVDTYFPSVVGFIATWSLYAFGVAFTTPGAFGALLSTARKDAGLAAGLIGATNMLGGALGGTLSGARSGLPTTTLGLFALIGGISATAGYVLSKPALRQQRQGREARAHDA
jgi:DHA1 family bicyclomycin/chloramphenicol resistance-like MFS transporter